MPLVKLRITPGIQKDGTRYSDGSTWVWNNSDKIRFREGFPEKIGGWVKQFATQLLGVPRIMMSWSDLVGNYLLGVGTNLKYYIQTGGAGGSVYDITPIRYTVTLNNPFTTINLSYTVTVAAASHGAYVGDFVTFSGATAVGGLTLNAEYQIVSVPSGNSFTITSASAATSGTTGGGASVLSKFQINTGSNSVVYGNGWGAGTWGGIVPAGSNTGWGIASTYSTVSGDIRLWSNDTYGQDLVFNVRNGGIYYWANSGGVSTRGVYLSALSGAVDVPAVARQIIVSNEDQKIIAFGCSDEITGIQDRLLIRWSDTAHPEIWTTLETNSAGSIRIPTGSEFISAIETKSETLVWSEVALHSLRYIGAPLEYGIQRIGLTTIMAPNAIVSANDIVFWMGAKGFFYYDGRINALPCTVKDFVFNGINLEQAEKVCSGSNMSHNEAWWFYPSNTIVNGVMNTENDSYVSYNYLEKSWFTGSIIRTAWIDRGIEDYPRATSSDGYVYYHENGFDDGSTNPPSAIAAFVESGILEMMQGGDSFGFAWRIIPDLTFKNSSSQAPKVTMTLKTQEFPGSNFDQIEGNSVIEVNPGVSIDIEQFTQQAFFRLRGREFTLRVSNSGITGGADSGVGITWRLGVPRIDVRPDGRR